MHVIPEPVTKRIENILNTTILGYTPFAGGCINQGGELRTSNGNYFIKWNDAKRYPEMFQKESAGLKLLFSKKCIHIPEVILVDTTHDIQFIVLELIHSADRKESYWHLLGERLAQLHKHSNEMFGLDHNNYIGSLPQINSHEKLWVDFFVEQRLEVQLSIAKKNKFIDASVRKKFDVLYKKLNEIFPNEKPALLHGDLWSGNLMINEKGEPGLIDPAVYYGHREAELAFTKLFGGFDSEFYEAYQESFPIEPEFDQRVEIYNLYPLLVHANLFGEAYIRQVRQILQTVT